VVHAAGVPGVGIIALKTREAAERVLAPKVLGTLALERALSGLTLDFFVVCSSLAALAGGAGQVDYCAANAFLDAWAAARRAAGQPTIAIDWDAWQQVGMAVNTAGHGGAHDLRATQLALALTPDEGIEVFRRVIDRDEPQIAVCTVGLAARLRPGARAAERHASTAGAQALHPRPELTTEYVAPASDLERQMAGAWQRVLGLEQVGVLDNFFDLGADSLTALRVVDRLKDEYGVDLSVTMFYTAPTIRLLAAQVAAAPELDARGTFTVNERI
jgi:acyl carrier protein